MRHSKSVLAVYLLTLIFSVSSLLADESLGAFMAKAEEQQLRDFKAQQYKDKVIACESNSGLGASYLPLVGKPVLLVACVVGWEEQGGKDAARAMDETYQDRVQFEVKSGDAKLAAFGDVTLTGTIDQGTQNLEVAAAGSTSAAVWVIAKGAGQVVVTATLVAKGKRAIFVDSTTSANFNLSFLEQPGSPGKFNLKSRRLAQITNNENGEKQSFVVETQSGDLRRDHGKLALTEKKLFVQNSGKMSVRTKRNSHGAFAEDGEPMELPAKRDFKSEKEAASQDSSIVTHACKKCDGAAVLSINAHGAGAKIELFESKNEALGADLTIYWILSRELGLFKRVETSANPIKAGEQWKWGVSKIEEFENPIQKAASHTRVNTVKDLRSGADVDKQGSNPNF